MLRVLINNPGYRLGMSHYKLDLLASSQYRLAAAAQST